MSIGMVKLTKHANNPLNMLAKRLRFFVKNVLAL
jgi:hypothetical protein